MKINELLSLMKVVRDRVNELKGLRNHVSTKDRYMNMNEKVTEPQYDVKKVDSEIVKLQNFLYLSDAKIKQANAITDVPDLTVDVSDLLKPLE